MAKSILAVDDSGSLRQMVVFSLRAAGYQVTEAVDGQDGLEKAKAQTFDLVLTDQNMPRMDGLTLIRSLRAIASYQRVPIQRKTITPPSPIRIKTGSALERFSAKLRLACQTQTLLRFWVRPIW